MKKQRLSKVLAACGIASRRACEELIFSGRVTLNQKVCLLPQTLVDPEKDKLSVDGVFVRDIEQKKYFIVNKPRGYICTARKNGKTPIVLDLFEGIKERLFTVGRLDKETEGLMIVTNDGHFANQVIHPSSNIKKEYIAKTNLEISDEHLKKISSGVRVEDTYVTPNHVSKVRKGTVKIVVSEGKKREVRLLLENAGLEVQELKRVRIGGLRLNELPTGHYREMTEKEKKLPFEE
jgi:23S rRNA pseudouridine2605 synthase